MHHGPYPSDRRSLCETICVGIDSNESSIGKSSICDTSDSSCDVVSPVVTQSRGDSKLELCTDDSSCDDFGFLQTIVHVLPLLRHSTHHEVA